MKTKVETVTIGRYDCDSIVVTLNGKKVEIVFDKKDNVKQYEGKMVELSNIDGIYTIKELKQFPTKQ